MRFAISGISRRGGREKASDVCAFVRDCKAGQFECQSPLNLTVSRSLRVSRSLLILA